MRGEILGQKINIRAAPGLVMRKIPTSVSEKQAEQRQRFSDCVVKAKESKGDFKESMSRCLKSAGTVLKAIE